MKPNFKLFSWLCTAIVSLLGFAACDKEIPSAAYGSPSADYKYMGTVTDEDGNPIKGINVVFQKQGFNGIIPPEILRIETDKNGKYETDYIHWNSGGIDQVTYTDVDGEENGGHFEDKTIAIYKMDKQKTGEGSGWYQGKYIFSSEIKLEAKPAEDNNEGEDNEGENE